MIQALIANWAGPLYIARSTWLALDVLSYAGLQETLFKWHKVDDP
jgi:hypothetical protein